MIPDYLVEEYQEIQHENGRQNMSFDEAQEELTHLSDILLTLTRFKEEHTEERLDDHNRS